MSSLHIDIEPHTCIDVLDIMTDDEFNVEEPIFNLDVCYGYAVNMVCPVADCNFQGLSHRGISSCAIGKNVMFGSCRS